MSRHELYAWAGLAFALAIAGYYILAVIGLPDGAESVSDRLGSIFVRVIVIAVAVELVLDASQSITRFRVDKDERDRMIEGRSFRNAYYILAVVVFAAIGQLVVTGLLGEYINNEFVVSLPVVTLHILVLGVLAASAINSVTRIYYYRRGS